MKKVLIGIFVLAIVIAVVVWQLYVNLDAIVARAIEDTGSKVTGTSVTVDGVQLQLLEGKGALAGVRVANPPGFTGQSAFVLENISLSIALDSLQDNPIVIDRLVVNQPQVFLELNEEGKSNLNVLKKNIQTYTSADGGAEPAQTEPVRFIIRKLVFAGGRISANTSLRPDEPVVTDLPAFEMNGLGQAQGGASGAIIAREVLQRLLEQAARAAGRVGVEAAKQKLEEKSRETIEKKFDGALDGLLGK